MGRFLLVCLVLAEFTNPGVRGQEAGPAGEPKLAGQPLGYWIKALKDPETLVREEAILVLGNAGPVAKSAVPALTPLLKDELPSIRVQAAIALGKIGGPSKAATEVLVEAWKGSDAALRRQIVPGLASLAGESPAVMALLLEASVAPDEKLRALGQETLVRVGPAAVGALTKVLENPDRAIRRQAVMTLGRMGHEARPAMPALTARLKDEDWETRWHAVQILWPMERQRGRLAPVVIEAASKADPSVRAAGLDLLFKLEPPPKEAAATFRAALQDEKPLTRVRAAVALWALEKTAKEILPTLTGVMQLPDAPKQQVLMAQLEALSALKQLGAEAKPARKVLLQMVSGRDFSSDLPAILAGLGPESIPTLIDLISGPKGDPHFRVCETLGLIGKESVDPLIKVLDHNDATIRYKAWRALEIIGAEALPAMTSIRAGLKSKDTVDRYGAVMCLRRIGPAAKDALPDLFEVAAKDPDLLIRHRALCALAHFHPEEKAIRPLLNESLRSPFPLIRLTAAEWLWHLDQDKSLVPKVADLLKDNATHAYAIQCLLRMGPDAKPAVPALIELLESDKAYLPALAARALQHMGSTNAKAAVPALIRVLEKQDPELRLAAAQALRHFGVEEKKAVAALLKDYDKAPEFFRQHKLWPALKEFGSAAKEALPRLQALLSHYSPFVRTAAAEIMVAIDPGQIDTVRPFLERALNEPANSTAPIFAAMVLWKADPKDQKAFLVLEDRLYDPHSRHDAVRVIGENAGPWAKAAVPALTHALKNSHPSVRISAARALWKIERGNQEPVPALMAVLKDKDSQYWHKEAAEALGEIGPAANEAVPVLQAALRSWLPHVRFAANEALRKIDSKAALPVLLEGY